MTKRLAHCRPTHLFLPGITATVGLMIFFALALVSCQAPASDVLEIGPEIVVTGGEIRGRSTGSGLHVYEGIPFAQAPIGALRWAPPQPVDDWDGVFDATSPGPTCAQSPGPEGGFYSQELGETSEDCLTLNVWTGAESTAELRPVMYWIHGGGLTAGSGSQYTGDVLASKGIVLVTINYRLGPFGFFAHPELSAENEGASGNQGLRDQIAGLEWVRDNIASFGGDPGNVTIFGESAGALSVSLVQASPLAQGLFHKAIGQSGGSFQPMTRLAQATGYSRSAEALGVELGTAVLAENGDEVAATLADLRAVPTDDVLSTFLRFNNYDRMAIVDGEVIPEDVATIFARGQQADVPVMIGSNADEGTTFLPYFQPGFGKGREGLENYIRATLPEVEQSALEVYTAEDDQAADIAFGHVFADVLFTYPQRMWARGMSTVSSPAYLYYFTWEPPVENRRYGAFHAADIGYVFGDLELFGATPTQADRDFSETISDLWTRFATTGDPNGDEIEGWLPYSSDNEAYYELGEDSGPHSHLRMEQIQVIDQAFEERREVTTGSAATGS